MALDPSSHTGVAEGEPGGVPRLSVQHFRQHKSDDVADIYARAVHWFADRLRHDVPDELAIEQPLPPMPRSNFDAHLVALGLHGIFIGIARCKRIRVRVASIASWRKFALGRGNLKGDEAKRRMVELCERLGWRGPDHNAAEAAGIWLYACALNEPAKVHRVEPLFTGVVA